jgi:hypothetical protein
VTILNEGSQIAITYSIVIQRVLGTDMTRISDLTVIGTSTATLSEIYDYREIIGTGESRINITDTDITLNTTTSSLSFTNITTVSNSIMTITYDIYQDPSTLVLYWVFSNGTVINASTGLIESQTGGV